MKTFAYLKPIFKLKKYNYFFFKYVIFSAFEPYRHKRIETFESNVMPNGTIRDKIFLLNEILPAFEPYRHKRIETFESDAAPNETIRDKIDANGRRISDDVA